LFRRFDEELRGDRVLEQAVTVLGEIERLVVPCGIVLRIQDEAAPRAIHSDREEQEGQH
jgi:hypothetical protein